MLTACGCKIVKIKNNKNMNTIKFIPATFENIDFESVRTEMCPCSPNFPHEINEVNILKINVPEKIFFHSLDEKIIPVCIAYSISILRDLKYHNYSKEIFHIKPENGKIAYSGEFFDKRAAHKTPYIPIDTSEYERQRINDAQKLSDAELDEGAYSRGYLNVNALDYVPIPIKSGKYEVWVTYYGLESNHVFVEIFME
jgi:hypothetical protein